MSYEVTMQGGLPNGSGTETELHHVREALANFYADLEERGHALTTAFINGVPHNFQDAKERDTAVNNAQEHYASVQTEAEAAATPAPEPAKATDAPAKGEKA